MAKFPEHYSLYEHSRVNTPKAKESSEGNEVKASKPRRDIWLYGHPSGPKCRFKNPAEFFPHLLWLATDDTKDDANCWCKWCVPDSTYVREAKFVEAWEKSNGPWSAWTEKLEAVVGMKLDEWQKLNGPPSEWGKKLDVLLRQRKPAKPEEPLVKKEQNSQGPSNTHKFPMVVIQKRPSSTDTTVKPVPTAQVTPSPSPALGQNPQSRTQLPLSSTPIRAPRNSEQAADAQCNMFLYRLGEVVWFTRGTAWGLAVIINRSLFKDQRHQDRPEYTCQPLSHPFNHPPPIKMMNEDGFRPWLAWSAPTPLHADLKTINLPYNQIDWGAVVRGHYGEGDAEVDGSIFAAKTIDGSYTPVELLGTATTPTMERYYNGIYSGGEKIWVGEPVRLRINTGKEILVINQIIERFFRGPDNAMMEDIQLVGDLYSFTKIPIEAGNIPPNNPHLPVRLREDLNYRNRAATLTNNQPSYWQLLEPLARVSLGAVKGRWYESRVLLPILHGQDNFANSFRKGDVKDVGEWMNGRGDSTGTMNQLGTKYNDRLDAFGLAVPMSTRIGPVAMPQNNFPVDPALMAGPMTSRVPVAQSENDGGRQQMNGNQQVGNQEVNDADISELVNLDQIDDWAGV